jgi:chromosome partitioning protein
MKPLYVAASALGGGMGKSTLIYYLSLLLAKTGKNVLVIDLDPSCFITKYFAFQVGPKTHTTVEFITRPYDPSQCIHLTRFPGISIIPSDKALEASKQNFPHTRLETDSDEILASKRIKQRLAETPYRFDYVLLDSPPERSHLSLAAICAADHILIPLIANEKGPIAFINSLDYIHELISSTLARGSILGIVPFQDRWIGNNQTHTSRHAIQAMASILELSPFSTAELFPSILTSDTLIKGLSSGKLPSDYNQPNLEFPFHEIIATLEPVKCL